MKFSHLIIGVMVGCCSMTTLAQDTVDFGNRQLKSMDVIDALRMPSTNTSKSINKRIVVRPKLSMQVLFEFDSARLTDQAEKKLDVIAAALTSSELSGNKFLIEGHTDATGSRHYNQGLSERRARAVRNYLRYQSSVHVDRLDSVGKGESDLLDRENSGSSKNRRVVIVNLGS
jgi:outer membrane protein OmpA-like peptidoglycan-associated protein